MNKLERKPGKLLAWILAARPKTLAAAAVPVTVGSCLAFSDGAFSAGASALCFGFAFLMQICANFINDLLDFKKGSDGAERIGPRRACAQGWISPSAMVRGIAVCAACACACGCGLLFYGGIELIAVGAACVLFAYLYTGGPFPLSERGLGDVAVIVFFGFVPVCFTYYVMAHSAGAKVFAASLACGLVVDTLLILNNYRDRIQDFKNGKMTTVVIFGPKAGGAMYFLFGVAACMICSLFAGNLWGALLPQAYLPLHAAAWLKMLSARTAGEYGKALAMTSANMALFGLLLGIGVALPSPF